jgi:hypothetical protein
MENLGDCKTTNKMKQAEMKRVSCKKNRFVNVCFVFLFIDDFFGLVSFLLCLVSFLLYLVSFLFSRFISALSCFVSVVSCFVSFLLVSHETIIHKIPVVDLKTFKIYGNLGTFCAATSPPMYLEFFSDFQNFCQIHRRMC